MSGEFKGTPGPWVASKTGRGIGPISGLDDQSFGMIIEVAYVEFDPEIEIQVANANLIAAAPELLEALQNMVEAYQYEASIDNPALLSARAAIAKALGKKQ